MTGRIVPTRVLPTTSDGAKSFNEGVEHALANATLQERLRTQFAVTKQARRTQIPFDTPTDAIRERGKLIRAEVIAHLDEYLEQFVENATKRGIEVHLARTPADARRIVIEIARRNKVETVTKGKSMVSEEMRLREALEDEGLTVIETDLGELLVQLAGQAPSHILLPAAHLDMRQITEVLEATAEGEPLTGEPLQLMKVSRRWLRGRFFKAEMGITGANFGIAETGQFFIVTNEGNGRMTATLPRVHVAMMGIERLLPTIDSIPTLLQLLTRAATGQWLSVYTTFFGGPRREGELHGPDEQHIVLVDNGRSKLLGTEYAEALECIRCGACLNVCPVYEKSSGHTYQSVYGGPIGKIVTPLYGSSPISNELPHASSLCGACKEACPIKIDIPNMLIKLRRTNKMHGPLGRTESLAVSLAGRALASPMLYKTSAAAGRLAMGLIARDGWVRKAPPPLANWTINRDLPAPVKKSFRQRWKERRPQG